MQRRKRDLRGLQPPVPNALPGSYTQQVAKRALQFALSLTLFHCLIPESFREGCLRLFPSDDRRRNVVRRRSAMRVQAACRGDLEVSSMRGSARTVGRPFVGSLWPRLAITQRMILKAPGGGPTCRPGLRRKHFSAEADSSASSARPSKAGSPLSTWTRHARFIATGFLMHFMLRGIGVTDRGRITESLSASNLRGRHFRCPANTDDQSLNVR